ncbi:MAG TPA: hypothetical protein DEO31_07710 [Streptococcus sp.]|nr:hypothetical protein [Streptococcus sp.]
MRYLKRLARRYLMQTFLFLFNAGIFTWLQTTGTMIANRLGLSGDDIWIYIPNWVKTLNSYSIESIQTLYGASGWSWLITSMLLTWLLTFLRGLMRALILILIVGLGLWLVYRHFELLQKLKLS